MRFGAYFRLLKNGYVGPGYAAYGSAGYEYGMYKPAVVFGSPFDSTQLGSGVPAERKASPYLCVR